MSEIAPRTVADILASLDGVKMSKTARAEVERALREVEAATEARCTSEGIVESARRSVEYAARAGYLEALRDVADELQRHGGDAHEAAVLAHREALHELYSAPAPSLAVTLAKATHGSIEALQGELRAATEAAPAHERAHWFGVQPLTGLRQIARTQAETAITVTDATKEGDH